MYVNKDPKKKQKTSSSEEAFVPKIHWYQKIPYPIKAIFIKWWFIGMEFYFFQIGLGYFFQGDTAAIILMLVTGLVFGTFNDIFVYPILDVVESRPGQARFYILFKSKKLYSLFINMAYGLLWGVAAIEINGMIKIAFGLVNSTWYGYVEALVFATLGFALDEAVVLLKDLIVWIVQRKIRHKSKEEWSYVF